MTTLNIGILGAGRIGKVHARTLAWRVPSVKVLSIADPHADAARALAAEVGASRVYADPGPILADPDIHAVLVCSSTDTHARLVEEAARAGKHVFCEKPLDLDLARIDAVLDVVRSSGVTLMLGFNRRFDPDFRRVREVVASGAVGEPHLVRITSRDPGPPPISYVKVSGGMFMDMTIHDFDMARYVTGAEVEEVFTAAAVRVDPAIGQAGDVDTAVITLKFSNGAIGFIENSRKAVYGYDQRIEVLGSAGAVANGNRAAHTVVVSDSQGIHGPLPLNFFMERYTDAYEAEIRAFVDCIVKGTPAPVDGRDARAAVVMALAARLSLQEGRPVRTSEVG